MFLRPQTGAHIRVVRGASVLAADFIDLSPSVVAGGEQGLLGLAFAPDAAVSGRFFVNFTDPAATPSSRASAARVIRLSPIRHRASICAGAARAAAAFIAQPFANHNGGNLAFGPDGFLYIGLGDGGSGNDPDHRAQNPAELLGKMLRIDVNVAGLRSTGIRRPGRQSVRAAAPATRPEIWAVGLRNPWRYSFDDPARGGTGALVIGDVGQDRFEEIDYEPPARGGRNYGWRNREGAHDNVTSLPPAFCRSWIRSTSTTTPSASRSREATCIAGARCRRRTKADTSSPTSSRAACGRSR